jgi:hypothetical protein
VLKSSANANNGSKCGAPVGVLDACMHMCMQLAASKAVLNEREIKYILYTVTSIPNCWASSLIEYI